MAEESPRPATEEESEEEEGEEAAEAPVLEDTKEEEAAPVLEDSEEEAAGPKGSTEEPPAVPEPPPEEEQVPVHALPPRRGVKVLLPTPTKPPAFNHLMAVYPSVSQYYYPVAPAYPSSTTTSTTNAGVNLFANDGSFMELFKKKMEQNSAGSKEEAASPEEKEKKPPEPDKRRPISFVGKRRGGAKLALKTGMVAKKPKTDEEEVVVQKGGAWAQYMAEVKKYKAHQCSDDDKTRPLVK